MPIVLARAIGDAGATTSALMPWNSCGAYVAATLAIQSFDFAGYAFFCLLAPTLTVLIGLLNFRIVKIGSSSGVPDVPE
jgi:NhaC family Na+:H+ antiporter